MSQNFEESREPCQCGKGVIIHWVKKDVDPQLLRESGRIERPDEELAMTPTPDRDALRDRFVEVLLTAARPLQGGSDPELTLEALIEAAGVVQERLRQELAELRVEQVE